MGRKPQPPLKVSVVPIAARGVWAFRWLDPDGKTERQKKTEVEIGGPSAKARQQSRTVADRAAVDFEAELRAKHAAEEAAAAASRRDDLFAPQIDGYLASIELKGATLKHLDESRSRLERFAREARRDVDLVEPLEGVRDITEDCITRFLAGLKRVLRPRKPRRVMTFRRQYRSELRKPAEMPPPPPPQPASQQTKNHYISSIKAFCAYLVRKKILAENPAGNFRRLSCEADLRRERRAIEPDEFARLIQAAQNGRTVEAMSGADRAMMYIVATWTGFRRKELASMTLRSFDLDADEPELTCEASHSKHRKEDRIPLHSRVVEAFRAWVASKGIISLDAPVFALRTRSGILRKTDKMMKVDLAAAGLPYRDEEGLYADFHSNRASYITNLVRSGIPFFRVVKLARHSDPKLTQRYDKATRKQLAGDVEKLPSPPNFDGFRPVEPTDILRFGGV